MGVAQRSFAAGEVSAAIGVRADLEKYRSALKKAENFEILPEGGAQNRAGFTFIHEVKDSTKRVVLIPFVFNDQQTYVLEFGEFYIRFYSNGGIVSVAADPYEIASPYASVDLDGLDYAQSGDIITLVHTAYPIHELKRFDHTNWTLTPFETTRKTASPATIAWESGDQAGDSTHLLKEWQWVVTAVNEDESLPSPVLDPPGAQQAPGIPRISEYTPSGDLRRYVVTAEDASESLASPILFAACRLGLGFTAKIAWDAVPGATDYNIYRFDVGDSSVFGLIGTIVASPTPEFIDTGAAPNYGDNPPTSVAAGKVALYGDKPVRISWGAVDGAQEYNVYRGRNGIMGFIGTAPATRLYFDDDGNVPDYAQTPPQAKNPFLGTGNYPGAVAYHEQRLVFGGPDNRPQSIDGSRPGDFANFDVTSPQQPDDAYSFPLASQKFDGIRELLSSAEALIVWTASTVFRVKGSGGDAIAPDSLDSKSQGAAGASKVKPVFIDGRALWVDARRSGIRELHYELGSYAGADGYASDDLSLLSLDLFLGYSIVSMAFTQQPRPIVWAVRSDGILLGLTYLPRQEIWAWHHHTTDGAIEWVCSVPEGAEDVLYASIRRTVNGVTRRYIERKSTRTVTSAPEGVFLDSSVTYDGRGRTEEITITAADWTPDMLASANAVTDAFVLADVSKFIVLAGSNGQPIRFLIEAVTTPRQAMLRIVSGVPEDMRSRMGITASEWDLAVSKVDGLDHLIGKTVGFLGDGNDYPDAVVDVDGIAILSEPASIIHAGLRYLPEIETLDIDFGDQTVRDKRKRIPKVFVDVDKTRGLWAGSRRDKMQVYAQRTVADSWATPALLTDRFEIPIASDFALQGHVILQQRAALPCTILTVIPEVTIGG